MGDIVNLRTARKRKTRAENLKQAEQNRAKSGRTKSERLTVDAERKLAARRLDGVKRDTGGDGPQS